MPTAARVAVRRATESDATVLSEVLCASIRKLCAADHHDDPAVIAQWLANKTPEIMMRWIANPGLRLFLAELENRPAGVGCTNDDGEVLLNYVSPAQRFRGVSKALLHSMEAALTELKVESARLISTRTAHRFYLAEGWRDAGPPVSAFGIPGYPMEKTLWRADGDPARRQQRRKFTAE